MITKLDKNLILLNEADQLTVKRGNLLKREFIVWKPDLTGSDQKLRVAI